MKPLTLDRLCIHQVTLMQCGFRESIDCLARHGVTKTAVWRDKLDEVGTAEGGRILADAGVAEPLAVAHGEPHLDAPGRSVASGA